MGKSLRMRLRTGGWDGVQDRGGFEGMRALAMAWCWQGLLRGVGDPSQKMESVSALTSSQDFIGGVQWEGYSKSCFDLKASPG